MASNAASEAIEPKSRESLSSVSTTSLVFERLHEECEKAHRKPVSGRSDDDLEDEDPLKEEDDLETGPFLADAGERSQPMDRKCRRVVVIVGSVLLLVWLSALGFAIATGLHNHASNTEHDPDAQTAWGSKKKITLDQIFSGFWSAKKRTIDWIESPDGKDGLLIETNTPGKDYIIVRDVRSDDRETRDADQSNVANEKTLMKEGYFNYGGENYQPAWSGSSPDMKKVLLGVNRKTNWRHSFTATYFILDVETQKVEPLVPEQAKAKIQYAVWSPTSDAIAFVQDNNLFIRKLDDKKHILQVSDDGGPEYFYGIPDWVYEEEVLQDRGATWWSEDGKYISFFRTNETGVPEFPVQYFLSRPSGKTPKEGEENYPEVRRIKYPKAGSHNPVVDLMFYDVGKGVKFSVDISDQFKDDNRILNNVLWAGDKVLVKETNRVSDVVKLIHIDVPKRKGKTIHTIDVDKIDGGWFEISHKMTYIPADPDNGRPHDGYVDVVVHENYNHLAYFSPLDATDPVMLTSGDWEVVDAPSAVDAKNNCVYFVATRNSPIQRHVYSVKLDGTDLQPLTDTSKEAYYTASFSADAGFLLLSYLGPKIPFQKVISTPSSPVTYDKTLEDNAELANRAKQHDLPLLEYGTVDVGDGVKLNYIERRPRNFNPKKRYPVLFQQYSGPGSQTVTKKFAVDFQAYIAASLGYLCITVDPRGTGFMGRKHRVAVRGNIGHLEALDHIAAAKHFAAKKYVDASRLAIWGWSYGGFTTLKTLEQDAGATYSYGMAVAPVTDWRFYDSVYTERYMRLPSENEAGYDSTKVSNATALGENVRFLMMHGVSDDNVHFQNTLHLLDDLDLAGVENYDVHVFPDSDHSIYFHGANRIVYDKLKDWLINAFNGEWLKIVDPVPKELATKAGRRLDRRDSDVLGPVRI